MSGRPEIGTSGFANVSPEARRREPVPAIRTTASLIGRIISPRLRFLMEYQARARHSSADGEALSSNLPDRQLPYVASLRRSHPKPATPMLISITAEPVSGTDWALRL